MGYGKLAKGLTQEEIQRRLRQVMPPQKFKQDFSGTSPPSFFVGSHNYPDVSAGILSPQRRGNTRLMDSPGEWYDKKLSVEKVASLRTSLVNSKKRVSVKEPDSFLQSGQELAMARKPVDLDIKLEKRPYQEMSSGRVKPVSASGNIQQMTLGENPSVDKKVEKAFYDHDMRAETGVSELFQKDVEVYRIQQALSAGMLGEKQDRKIVPTRWSITAVDDMTSEQILDRVKMRQELGEILHFENKYLGNRFHIFLIPGRWEYELIEIKRKGSVWAGGSTFLGADYEPFNGRTEYAQETSGAFYAAKLSVLKHLDSIKRQAKVLIVRDVKPEYWAPLGVWVIRETVRNAFSEAETLEEREEVKKQLARSLPYIYKRVFQKSVLLNKTQSNLKEFSM